MIKKRIEARAAFLLDLMVATVQLLYVFVPVVD